MSKDIKYVTLPYDFISLPDEYYYPYDKKKNYPPLHSEINGISGYIKYSLAPKTDISVELRKGLEAGELFISGSCMRGRVRANLEMLSKSYPEFINTTPMLYRAVADSKELGKLYKNKLCNQEKNSIEQADIERKIYVGFLRKDVNDFYVVPAEKFSNDRKFLSIKEHRLYNIGLNRNNFYPLYDDTKLKDINEIQKEVDKLSMDIKRIREALKDCLGEYNDTINKIFLDKYSFKKALEDIKNIENLDEYKLALKDIEENLISCLKKETKTDNEHLTELFEHLAKRWRLKAEINFLYTKKQRYRGFMPYQKSIFYKKNINGGIADISADATTDCTEKGYIYNSTNASSKRSHYIVNKPKEKEERYSVPPEVINSYNQNHKKFRVTSKYNSEKIKEFYNIFTDYEKLIKNNLGTSEGLIVFFQLNEDKANEISMIGRTPYFKIPYEHSLRRITGNKEENNIDYADAIFGFISNNANESKLAYKSRVRFSAIDIKGSIEREDREFLLTTPSATACAMYLKQRGVSLSTYEDKNPPELNGYKYYRMLDNAQADTVPEDRSKVEKMISNKEVIKAKDSHYKHGYALEGKIYFNNLNENELGLLLLSLDIRKLSATSKYKEKLEEVGIDVSSTYEQIGGAKPYGYGAVEVKIDEMHLEKTDSSFETLIGNNMKKLDASEELDCTKYIDGFLTEMLNYQEIYFDYLKPYIESKCKKLNNENCITWANIGSKIGKNGGGYPVNWRLKTYNTKI